MSTALIVRTDGGLSVIASPDIHEAKELALNSAAVIVRVTNAEEQTEAVAAQAGLREVIKAVEKSRVEVKGPILDFGRKIDYAAAELVAEVKEEELRIAKLNGDFQTLMQAKARAEEEKRQAELRAIEEERRRKEREAILAAEAENRRLLEEQRKAQREAAEATTAAARALAEQRRIEAERAQEEAAAKSHDELDAIAARANQQAQMVQEQPKIEPPKVRGQVVKTEWEITVFDIHALYRAHPSAVKMEPLMTEIKQRLDGGAKLPGVKAERVTKSTVATRQGRLIEV